MRFSVFLIVNMLAAVVLPASVNENENKFYVELEKKEKQSHYGVLILLVAAVVVVLTVPLIPGAIMILSYSNVKFIPEEGAYIRFDVKEIEFKVDETNTEIPVNKETKELMCVANATKDTVWICLEFEAKNKREIRIPLGKENSTINGTKKMVKLREGEGYEFEIFIKPLCTCSVTDDMLTVTYNVKRKKVTGSYKIPMKYKTVLTKSLDPEEIHEEELSLGEGSFGNVFKGTFRDNNVAVKKIKESTNPDEQKEEFIKETAMLEKLHYRYIVYYYGSVFISEKNWIVTEFAPLGSLYDLIMKQEIKQDDKKMRIKILLDAARGIQYLHNNEILHRDIKPANILIFDIDRIDDRKIVNAKLTDFGSAIEIKALEVAFRESNSSKIPVGTPAYMSPEMLQAQELQQSYSKPTDIYSFGITMFECMKGGKAYPEEMIKIRGKLEEFVIGGSRLEKPESMEDDMYTLITQCWCQDPKERLPIEQIITSLSKLL